MRLVCKLRQHRQPLSLRELERATGIHRSHLSRIENGHMLPTDEQARLIAEAVGTEAPAWYWPLRIEADGPAAAAERNA